MRNSDQKTTRNQFRNSVSALATFIMSRPQGRSATRPTQEPLLVEDHNRALTRPQGAASRSRPPGGRSPARRPGRRAPSKFWSWQLVGRGRRDRTTGGRAVRPWPRVSGARSQPPREGLNSGTYSGLENGQNSVWGKKFAGDDCLQWSAVLYRTHRFPSVPDPRPQSTTFSVRQNNCTRRLPPTITLEIHLP